MKKGAIILVLAIVLLFTVLPNGTTLPAAAQDIKGSIKWFGNQRVLNLWGTNYEMGYAHGYLLADIIQKHIGDIVKEQGATNYQGNVDNVNQSSIFYPEYTDEINGIIDGAIASGKGYISSLKRNVTSGDIKYINSEVETLCSALGVWGNTTDNKTIIARNYDVPLEWATSQVMFVREPASGPKTVSWGHAGWIGTHAGMNEYGIVVTSNSGGEAQYYGGGVHLVVENIRYILEHTTPSNYMTQPLAIDNAVQEYLAVNILIGAPNVGQANPAYCIEDAEQNVIRYADKYPHIVVTNHQYSSRYGMNDDSSIARYNSIYNGLVNLYNTGDHIVSSAEAASLLRNVEESITIQTAVFRPASLSFDAWISDGVSPSLEMTPVAYTWAGLFPNHVESTPDTTPPSVPGGLVATAISTSQINLSWSASTDDVAVAGYKVFRDGTQIATTTATSYSNTGLQASTTFTYTVVAYDAVGNTSPQSSPVSATTKAPDTTPPSIPGGLTATAISASQINLSWSASTDDVSVAGYKVFRDGTQIATTTATSYSNTGLQASTTYSYTVAAYDAVGNTSLQSSPVSATTKAPDPTPTISTFGLDSGISSYNEAKGRLNVMRFYNKDAGKLVKLEILFNDTTPNGNVRMGVYADNSGIPGALLIDAGAKAVTNGWVSISGLSLTVNPGYYWLGFDLSSANYVAYGLPAVGQQVKAVTYGALPTQYDITQRGQYVMRGTVQLP